MNKKSKIKNQKNEKKIKVLTLKKLTLLLKILYPIFIGANTCF